MNNRRLCPIEFPSFSNHDTKILEISFRTDCQEFVGFRSAFGYVEAAVGLFKDRVVAVPL